MDRTVQRNPRSRWIKIAALVALALVALVALWSAVPRGLAVKTQDVDVATVAPGTFLDALVQRSSTLPASSVFLDATEGGRVEEVLVHDGEVVKKGQLLFRLSNPGRQQDVLARSADVAQQLSNLSNLRAFLAQSQSSIRHQRAAVEYDLDRARKSHARNVELARQGFISKSGLEESADNLAQQQRLLQQARTDGDAEIATREQSIKEMEGAINGLQTGLRIVREAVDALAVRAPVDGRLTGFELQVGESVKANDRLGRIDSPDRYKLTADVDEFYLNRVSPGLHGTVALQGKTHPVTVTRLNPQVKAGRFTIQLNFDGASPPGMQPGQSMDVTITLGQPSRALLLPEGLFYADTGGAWVFVIDPDGRHAERRNVRLGRRAAGQIEVLGGLAAGERVIISGYRRFGDTQRLRLES